MNPRATNRNTVCFMNSNKVWGGGEKWHFETACYLDQLGYSVLVLTNKSSDLYRKLLGHKSILLESVAISNFSFLNPLKLNYIKNLLKSHAVSTVFLGLSIDVKLGGLAARKAGIDSIIYRRGSALPVRNSFFNRYLFHKVLTCIITNSEEIKSNIFQRNPKIVKDEKVQIIYNGIDFDTWPSMEFFNGNREDKKCLTLGNAGRLVEQKGQEYLIKIAKHLKDKEIPFRLYIAGSGELERTLKNECRAKGVAEEVVFLDFVEDMNEFLKELDIYLSTSLHEGSSHVIIEAMGAGKPVIAFDVSSMPELVVNGETGYLVTFGDTLQFAEKIIELKNNSGDLEKMGRKARLEVEKKFNFKSNIQKVLELIEK